MDSTNEIYHYGILGMKWGIRRYQNPDGSLTKEGLERYRDPRKMTTAEITQANTRAAQIKAYKKNYPTRTQRIKSKVKERLEKRAEVKKKSKAVTESYATVANKASDLIKALPKKAGENTVSRGRERATEILNSGAAALNLIGAMQGVSSSLAELRAKRIG